MKTRLLRVYEVRKGGSILLNPTTINKMGNRFATKNPTKNYGQALPKSVTDAELGRAIRQALSECD